MQGAINAKNDSKRSYLPSQRFKGLSIGFDRDIEIGERVVVVAGAIVTKSFLDENSVVDGGLQRRFHMRPPLSDGE